MITAVKHWLDTNFTRPSKITVTNKCREYTNFLLNNEMSMLYGVHLYNMTSGEASQGVPQIDRPWKTLRSFLTQYCT